MEKSKALARANWKGSGDKSVEERWFKIREELKPCLLYTSPSPRD